jgi:hypothetical protein
MPPSYYCPLLPPVYLHRLIVPSNPHLYPRLKSPDIADTSHAQRPTLQERAVWTPLLGRVERIVPDAPSCVEQVISTG